MGSGAWSSNATRMRFQPRRKTLTSRRRVARRIRGCSGIRAVTSGTVLAGIVSSASPPTLSSHSGATATAKRGRDRCPLDVTTCFVPLLAWIVTLWQGTPLALALDATTLGTRCTVLALSVVYRGCAIPVAWTVLAATATHAWRREWLRMLRQVRRAIPRTWTVIVLADRGLYARWLFRRITRLGWHPFLRINTGGTFRPTGQVRGVPLKTLVPEPGTTWQGTGIAFQGRHRHRHCPLLACWEPG